MKLLLLVVVSALFVGKSFCEQDELCTVDLASYGDARGTPQCLADAACYFYDEKANKCLPYWRRPDAELRIKFHIKEECEMKCVT